MNLQDMIDTRQDQDPVWVAHPESDTFQVLIRPLADKNQEFSEKAQKIEWNEATFERRVVIDQEIYLKHFNEWVIVDWKGLYVEDLRKLVLLRNFRQIKKYKGEIACDPLSRLLLMIHSPPFSAWIKQKCIDIEFFNQERERESEKN